MSETSNKKVIAGVLAILLGAWGVHKFYLGYTQEGIIYVAVTVVCIIISVFTCGIGSVLLVVPGVMGLVEGILYLTKSDEEFNATYVVGRKPWF